MLVQRSSTDTGAPFTDESEGGAISRGSFIQTALLLGSGVGMSVEPKSLQFLPMPVSGVKPRDHKVLFAVLAHTLEAVGIAKEMVGINVVKGSLAAVESLLTLIKVRTDAPSHFRRLSHTSVTLIRRSLSTSVTSLRFLSNAPKCSL